jgi:flavorubredoxin
MTEILANQLNTIFHKLDIPLDLGLNYQPNESGNDIFDVAVSTQLFNNRVVVNGNIGNKQYSTTGSQNDVVGDLDIEIKLNRPGSLRLSLFSHSADQFSNYLDNSQRNGVGIMYQTEFNSFRRFLRSIFTSKAKRQAAKMQEEQAMLQGGRNEISIERP